MKVSANLKVTMIAALAMGPAIFVAAPAAHAKGGNEQFWGTGSTESEAHQTAVKSMIKFEQEAGQECHQVSYSTYLTPLKPSTRLSGSWQYFLDASCTPKTAASEQ